MSARAVLSASPAKVLDLFDPDERSSFLEEHDTTSEQVLERFTASDLLIWIVRRRSAFVRMATDIAQFLSKLEASLKGNIEFVVTVQDSTEVDLAFGPQIRELLLAAESWIDHTAPELHKRLGPLERSVSAYCRDARTTQMERDSDTGGMLRELSERHPDPFERERLAHAADFMKSYETEVHPSDVAAITKVRDAARRVEVRVAKLFDGDPQAESICAPLRHMAAHADHARRRIAGYESYDDRPPHPQLDERRANRICRGLGEIESLASQAKRLDEAGADVLAAMALMLWQERWRIYELWVLCVIGLQLALRSEAIDSMGRIRDGRWTLKYTRDAKSILAFRYGEQWIDVFYQYFERGADRGNMPDIALRERATGIWLAIVDPKMGESYKKRDLAEVCARYARAFDARRTIIASYFPDDPATEILAEPPGSIVCHGLRPGRTGALKVELAKVFSTVGIALGAKTLVILADVSGSMSALRVEVASAIERAASTDPEIDPGASIVACFNDQWTEQFALDRYLLAPRLPESSGPTECDAAIRTAIAFLADTEGDREIWLFSDAQPMSIAADDFVLSGIRFCAYLPSSNLTPGLRELCKTTGGIAIELETLFANTGGAGA